MALFHFFQKIAVLCYVILMLTISIYVYICYKLEPATFVDTDASHYRSSGSSSNDGEWMVLHNPIIELYVYSAFYDDRHVFSKDKRKTQKGVVRIIGVSEEPRHTGANLLCMVFNGSERKWISRMTSFPIGTGISLHNKWFREFIFDCPFHLNPLDRRFPLFVSIVTSIIDTPSFYMPVVFQERVANRRNFTVCVQPSYRKLDPLFFIEWIEILQLLGIEKVNIYNRSLEADFERFITSYVEKGIVDVRQMRPFLKPDDDIRSIILSLTPGINDCLYRNMYVSKWIIIIDLDELILPRKLGHLSDLLNLINANKYISEPDFYQFRNTYHFLDLPSPPVTNATQWDLLTIKHRSRLRASPLNYAMKSIINPKACINMHHHGCWRETKIRTNSTLLVDPNIALLHHYKTCHFDVMHCKIMMKHFIVDNNILHFADQLVKNVKYIRQKLDL